MHVRGFATLSVKEKGTKGKGKFRWGGCSEVNL